MVYLLVCYLLECIRCKNILLCCFLEVRLYISMLFMVVWFLLDWYASHTALMQFQKISYCHFCFPPVNQFRTTVLTCYRRSCPLPLSHLLRQIPTLQNLQQNGYQSISEFSWLWFLCIPLLFLLRWFSFATSLSSVLPPSHYEPFGSASRGIEGGLATLTSSKVVTL